MAFMGLPQAAYALPQPEAKDPFVWGSGGAQLTPEEMANRRAIAQGMMKSDYSPVQNVWQGLGRVADNWLGAFDARKLDKQADAASERNNAIAQALLGKGGGEIAGRAMIDPYASPEVQKLGQMQWERANPKPSSPHYWETNNGSLGVIGPDGSPQIIYQDPTPKIEWITAQNADGTKTLIPMQQGAAPSQGVPTAPVGRLTPIPDTPMPQDYAGPTPDKMRELYIQQFGQRGESMFQEWLRNSQGGR